MGVIRNGGRALKPLREWLLLCFVASFLLVGAKTKPPAEIALPHLFEQIGYTPHSEKLVLPIKSSSKLTNIDLRIEMHQLTVSQAKKILSSKKSKKNPLSLEAITPSLITRVLDKNTGTSLFITAKTIPSFLKEIFYAHKIENKKSSALSARPTKQNKVHLGNLAPSKPPVPRSLTSPVAPIYSSLSFSPKHRKSPINYPPTHVSIKTYFFPSLLPLIEKRSAVHVQKKLITAKEELFPFTDFTLPAMHMHTASSKHSAPIAADLESRPHMRTRAATAPSSLSFFVMKEIYVPLPSIEQHGIEQRTADASDFTSATYYIASAQKTTELMLINPSPRALPLHYRASKTHIDLSAPAICYKHLSTNCTRLQELNVELAQIQTIALPTTINNSNNKALQQIYWIPPSAANPNLFSSNDHHLFPFNCLESKQLHVEIALSENTSFPYKYLKGKNPHLQSLNSTIASSKRLILPDYLYSSLEQREEGMESTHFNPIFAANPNLSSSNDHHLFPFNCLESKQLHVEIVLSENTPFPYKYLKGKNPHLQSLNSTIASSHGLILPNYLYGAFGKREKALEPETINPAFISETHLFSHNDHYLFPFSTRSLLTQTATTTFHADQTLIGIKQIPLSVLKRAHVNPRKTKNFPFLPKTDLFFAGNLRDKKQDIFSPNYVETTTSELAHNFVMPKVPYFVLVSTSATIPSPLNVPIKALHTPSTFKNQNNLALLTPPRAKVPTFKAPITIDSFKSNRTPIFHASKQKHNIASQTFNSNTAKVIAAASTKTFLDKPSLVSTSALHKTKNKHTHTHFESKKEPINLKIANNTHTALGKLPPISSDYALKLETNTFTPYSCENLFAKMPREIIPLNYASSRISKKMRLSSPSPIKAQEKRLMAFYKQTVIAPMANAEDSFSISAIAAQPFIKAKTLATTIRKPSMQVPHALWHVPLHLTNHSKSSALIHSYQEAIGQGYILSPPIFVAHEHTLSLTKRYNNAMAFKQQCLLADMEQLLDYDHIHLEDKYNCNVQYTYNADDKQYEFEILLSPKPRKSYPQAAQNFIFIVDSSAHINSQRFAGFKKGIIKSLPYIKPSDSIALITADKTFTPLFATAQPASKETKEHIKDFIYSLRYAGYYSKFTLNDMVSYASNFFVAGKENILVILSDTHTFANVKSIHHFMKNFSRNQHHSFSIYAATCKSNQDLSSAKIITQLHQGQLCHSPTVASFPRHLAIMVKHAGNTLSSQIDIHIENAKDSNVTLYPSMLSSTLFSDQSFKLYGKTNNLNSFVIDIKAHNKDAFLTLPLYIDFARAKQDSYHLPKTMQRQKALSSLHTAYCTDEGEEEFLEYFDAIVNNSYLSSPPLVSR
ncbi:hypothetical protein COB21_02710 [Candidatus Aerophobetes bacterium]|uniref:VWFA domain-containing protein n=1 Tax=Aerophobetes bacterium TaxID=2030807 RepID=A0A2A4X559_UNCAE|nr:MAG: hypothetical protein COB21_02710 [Candidatus Aerophobetes bacterium]